MEMLFALPLFSATGSTTDPVDLLLRYGFAGIVVLLLVLGWLWPKPAVDGMKDGYEKALAREQSARERAEAARDTLVTTYETRIIPALVDVTAMSTKSLVVIEDVKALLVELRTIVREHGGDHGGDR